MSELDDKLNSILSNPQMMQQIMSLAQSMNQAQTQAPPPPQPATGNSGAGLPEGGIDPGLLSKMAGLVQRGSIDKDQKLLLQALRPYLSGQKLQKLERAMHAAKMASIASDVVNARGQIFPTGR